MKYRRSLFATALAAALLGGCAGAGTRTGAAIDDGVITTKVKTALLADKRVSGLNVGVETHQGRVLLSGFAKSPDERQAAEGIARSIEGVRHVDNKIAVQ